MMNRNNLSTKEMYDEILSLRESEDYHLKKLDKANEERDSLQKENDELRAHINDLLDTIETDIKNNRSTFRLKGVFLRIPEQSLAKVRAEAIREAVKKHEFNGALFAEDLYKEAEQLEKDND